MKLARVIPVYFLLTQSVFCQSQYGLRPKHATTHAISEFVDETIEAFENSNSMLGVLLDLSKAFDAIDHVILLKKTFEWYGSNRKQFVKYKNAQSPIHNIPCGVPQGSVLGSLLLSRTL